jgi:hypothetical protein
MTCRSESEQDFDCMAYIGAGRHKIGVESAAKLCSLLKPVVQKAFLMMNS